MVMVGQATIILTMVWGMVAAATDNGVWVAVENRIDSFSPTVNNSLNVPTGKHIIGLSNPAFQHDQFSYIFATELGVRGPAVYQISKHEQTLLAELTGFEVAVRLPDPELNLFDALEKLENENPLNPTHTLINWKAPVSGEMPSYFEDVTFDQETSQLFLTSKNTQSIYSMPAIKGGQLTTFLSTKNKKPTGISLDPCSRNVFWTNSDRKFPSIEVFHPDTGTSWPLVSTNLTRPKAITVDTPGRKLYWTDTRRGNFWISRSNLDGTEREVVCKGKDHEAFSITVSEEFIYWSDWTSHALWRTPKSGECNFELIQKFTTSKPHGVSFIPDTKYNCDEYQDIVLAPPVADVTTTTKVPPPDTTTKPAKEDECTNFCLTGDCSIISGKPVCECSEGYEGSRCQIDKCFNFCLEDGKCFVLEDEPECLCSEGFQGDRCQIAALPIVDEYKQTLANESSSKSSPTSGNLNILVYILGGTTGALTIIVILLSVLVNRLRLRPRVVRKRFISIAGADRKEGKMTKPSSSCGLPVDDGIQLDIENCCNMTLCDTPCFEPPTRGPKKSKKSSKGDQDKKSLLADDDEDF